MDSNETKQNPIISVVIVLLLVTIFANWSFTRSAENAKKEADQLVQGKLNLEFWERATRIASYRGWAEKCTRAASGSVFAALISLLLFQELPLLFHTKKNLPVSFRIYLPIAAYITVIVCALTLFPTPERASEERAGFDLHRRQVERETESLNLAIIAIDIGGMDLETQYDSLKSSIHVQRDALISYNLADRAELESLLRKNLTTYYLLAKKLALTTKRQGEFKEKTYDTPKSYIALGTSLTELISKLTGTSPDTPRKHFQELMNNRP